MVNANLRLVDMRGADMHGANLSWAQLRGAKVSEDQLQQSRSLEGATMPDGQKYEEWLKSEGRGQDGKYSSPS